MNYNRYSIVDNDFCEEKRYSKDALFTVGNGYYGIRGFYEEENKGIGAIGGIYMAGIFGKGSYDAWVGKSRELCNVANVLKCDIKINKEILDISNEAVSDFKQELNMKSAVYKRSYVYTASNGKRIRIYFERFASLKDRHLIGQKITVKALDNIDLELSLLLCSNVTNLNKESLEPLPIQPGRNHIIRREIKENYIKTTLDDVDNTTLYFAQKVNSSVKGKNTSDEFSTGVKYHINMQKDEIYTFEKIVSSYTSKDENIDCEYAIAKYLKSDISYEEEKNFHIEEWAKKWEDCDIEITGNTNDQSAIRYNIFELICACPEHTDKLSIGARGLTGEMYEGCVFWDTEIFKLPFFTFTNPEAAKKLLKFRYHTLENAKKHAKANWLEGAMYPWQVSEKGIEQTPYNTGAFYAIHIVSDIAYAIKQYLEITGDIDFIANYAGEILIETARFWASRCDFNKSENYYEIKAVRGPNEYDVYVNNNTYTNLMAKQNLLIAIKAVRILGKNDKDTLLKLSINSDEIVKWQELADKICVPFNGELDLYLEDDKYFERRPLDLRKAKPTGKRIIDSTLPYEALPLYQVTKQADTVLLMNLLPHRFTKIQKETAYNYYEPKTAHDSSLSYAPYGVMAANIGFDSQAYEYFKKSAYLDINNLQLNTVSGLHFANFGGNWKIIFFGFGGISQNNKTLFISPNLPEAWDSMKLNLIFQNVPLKVEITKSEVIVSLKNEYSKSIKLDILDNRFILHKGNPIIHLRLENK